MVPQTFEEFLICLGRMRRYVGPQRIAPHKPLVVLHALARFQQGERTIAFADAEAAVSPLLQRYWADQSNPRVEEPFVRLSRDGFWQLHFSPADAETPSGALSAAKLRKVDARAGFDAPTLAMLDENPLRAAWAARILLPDVYQGGDQAGILNRLVLNIDA